MALTTGNSGADAISPPGVTRQERLGNIAARARAATAGDTGNDDVSEPFIDDDELGDATEIGSVKGFGTGDFPSMPQAANIVLPNLPSGGNADAPQHTGSY
jgi:hypothetical protein